MPRAYFDYADQPGGKPDADGGDPVDFCQACWNKAWRGEASDYAVAVIEAAEAKGLSVHEGDDHPDYAEDFDYTCHECGRTLFRCDNDPDPSVRY